MISVDAALTCRLRYILLLLLLLLLSLCIEMSSFYRRAELNGIEKRREEDGIDQKRRLQRR